MTNSITASRRMAAILLAAAASPAFAQAGPQPTPSQPAVADEGIAEIVVTAQKRAENLQDTPISMVALTADSLEQRGINAMSDLFTGAVPSLRISPFIGRVSAVSIGMRGLVPVDATQITRDATVGIYIDSVYLGRVSGLGMELADVERIEILRGPQGTLFGRNTIGGAVSIVTKKPTGEFGADLSAGIGNYRGRSLAGHVNLPSIANVSIKVDALLENRGGLVENPLQSSRDFAEIRKSGFKVAALWRPVDDVSLLYSFDRSVDNSTNNYYYITRTDQAPAVWPSFISLDTRRVDVGRIGVPVPANPQIASGHSLTGEWDIADNLTLRSISAWRKLSSTQFDQDSGALTVWGPGRRFGRLSFASVDQNQFSQEIQLVGDIGDVKYVFGGYYFNENGRDSATVFSSGTLNATNTGVNLFPEPTPDAGTAVPDRSSIVNVKSKALFGQASWSPGALPGLHLTAGVRYTDDHKDGRLIILRGVDPRIGFTFDESRFDPMATIAYDFSDDINAYVKYSRAYRAGGANTRSFTLGTFGAEELTAWEIGLKADLFDRRVRFNAAGYTSLLQNQQVDFINPAFPSNTETVNAPESRRIKGAEVDLTIAPVRDLQFAINYVYTDAPPTPVRNIFTGVIQRVTSAFTPVHAVFLSADYSFPAFSFGQLRAHVDANTAGNYIPNDTVTFKADKAFLVNARLTLAEIAVANSQLELALWARNLTNATFNLVDFRSAGRSTFTVYNDPRTYGAQVRVRF